MIVRITTGLGLAIRKLDLEPQPVIIAVTAHAFKEERDEMIAAGCDEFLAKPLKDDDLFDLLGNHLPITIVRTAPKPEEKDKIEAQDLPRVLAALPTTLLTQLEQAAIEGDASQIPTLLVNYADALSALKPLIDDYRFDVLVDEISRQLAVGSSQFAVNCLLPTDH